MKFNLLMLFLLTTTYNWWILIALISTFTCIYLLISRQQLAKKAKETQQKLAQEQQKKEKLQLHIENLEQDSKKHNSELQIVQEDLQNAQAQLILREKMATLGELTAGVAHEIQNPLNFVNNFAEVSSELLDELQQELDQKNEAAQEITTDLKLNLEKISHHGKRASSIVNNMLDHARASSGQKEPTDLNLLIDECLRLSYHGLRAQAKSFNADYEMHLDDQLPGVPVVSQDIGRVLLNLFNNAFYTVFQRQKQSTEPGYQPRVRVSSMRTPSCIEIRISDNGLGIPPDLQHKIFQPFFTTKPSGEGTGLGLSLSYDIVTKGHGGKLAVESTMGNGSSFILELPYS